MNRTLGWVSVVLLLVLGAALGYRQINSPDIGFHLATADWIVAHGWVPQTDPLSYTVPDHAYIDLQWVFQLVIHALQKAAGPVGIVVVTILATFAFAGLTSLRSARREGRWCLALLPMTMLFFLGSTWEPRPHLLSWLWGSLLLLALEERGRTRKDAWLLAVPCVMVLWVNSHSLFILGLVILAAFVAADLRHWPTLDRKLWAAAIAGALACLVNPYHLRGFLLPLTQFGIIQSGDDFKSTLTGIAEFTTPFTFAGYSYQGLPTLFHPSQFWHLFMLLVIVGVALNRRSIKLVEWILLAGFLYIFWRTNKNFGYFVMIAIPLATPGIERAIQWLSHTGQTALRCACLAACVLLAAAAWTNWMHHMSWIAAERGGGFDPELLPVGASRFIVEHDIRGRIINSWDQGGYIAWATGQKVFIYSHAEVVGPEFYRRYVRAKQPEGFAPALEEWKPTIAVVPFRTLSFWLYHLSRAKDWRMVYRDRTTAIFLHESQSQTVPALPVAEAGVDYPLMDEATVARVVRESALKPPLRLRDWLRGAKAHPENAINLAGFFLHTGQPRAAAAVCAASMRELGFISPNLMLTLGHALNVQRRYDLADICFDVFLKLDRDPVIAEQVRQTRKSRK